MRIRLNGEDREVPEGCTVAELIESLGLVLDRVAVEHNLEVVRRARFGEVRLREGDQVELVTFVGGGA